MKKIIIMFVVGLLAEQVTLAQGTVYVSSLGQTSAGSFSVGSNSWLAVLFRAGNNVGGYTLNSIQLGMTDATGNPSGFMAMVYSAVGFSGGVIPGSSLGALNGSDNPSTAAVYTFNPTSSLTLSPSTDYFIVLTAGTAIANGAYEWNVTSTFAPDLSGGWHGDNIFENSSNGLSWNSITGNYPLFALTATPIPEPSVLGLLGLSSLLFILRRK